MNQAFKHVGVAGPIATRVAQAKVREVRFDARVDTLYTVKEGSMVGQASVLVEVKSGSVRYWPNRGYGRFALGRYDSALSTLGRVRSEKFPTERGEMKPASNKSRE